MKGKILLIILVFCMTCIWAKDAYPHGKEKHLDKRTVTEDKNIEKKAVESLSVLHEEHGHAKTVETGSFDIIQFGEKQGYNVAVVFTGFIAVIWGMISLYWRDK